MFGEHHLSSCLSWDMWSPAVCSAIKCRVVICGSMCQLTALSVVQAFHTGGTNISNVVDRRTSGVLPLGPEYNLILLGGKVFEVLSTSFSLGNRS